MPNKKMNKALNVIKAVNLMKRFQKEHVEHIKNNQQNQQDLFEGNPTNKQIVTDNPESICYNLYHDHQVSSSSETNYNNTIISFLNSEGDEIITQGNKEIQRTSYKKSGQKALDLVKKIVGVDHDITIGQEIKKGKLTIYINNVNPKDIETATTSVYNVEDNTVGFIHLPGKTSYLFIKENGNVKVKGLGDFLTHYSNKLEKDGSSSLDHIRKAASIKQQRGGNPGDLNEGQVVCIINGTVVNDIGDKNTQETVRKVPWLHHRKNREIVVVRIAILASIVTGGSAFVPVLAFGTALIAMNCAYKWLMGKERCTSSIWTSARGISSAMSLVFGARKGGRRRRTRRKSTKKRRRRKSTKKKRRRTKKKRRRRKRKRKTRRKKGGTSTTIGEFIITSSSKPKPGIAMAIAIDETYNDNYYGHCENHSRALYPRSPTWAKSTKKVCKKKVDTFRQRVFKMPPRR